MIYARATVRRVLFLGVFGAIGVLASACGHESKPPPRVGVGASRGATFEQLAALHTAEVPANTTFRVTMDDTLSSATAYQGQTFTATLTTPLIAKDVRIAAPAGSRLQGHVVSVESGSEPRIAVTFDSLETKYGLYGIEAHANDSMNVAFTIGSARDDEANADTVFRPGPGAIGGGPRAEGMEQSEQSHTTMVVVPKNSELELVLTSPLTITLMTVR